MVEDYLDENKIVFAYVKRAFVTNQKSWIYYIQLSGLEQEQSTVIQKQSRKNIRYLLGQHCKTLTFDVIA